MFKGGYQIIDLSAYTLSSTATTIAGLYDTITKAGKPLLISGAHTASVTFSPAFTNYVILNDKIVSVLITLIRDDGCLQYYLEIDSDSKVKLLEGEYAYTPAT